MRFLIVAIRSRSEMVAGLQSAIPTAEVVWDTANWHFDTYKRAMIQSNGEPTVFLEDDIILTDDFQAKCEAVIAERPDEVIQFFSMRKADLEVGSRYDRNFIMNQCFYLPDGFTVGYLAFLAQWQFSHPEHPNGSDLCLGDYLKERKQKYWIHVPNLVDHRECVSAIDRRRSSKRQSKTFE